MDIIKFDETLDMWTAEEASKAEAAKSDGDERGHSIALMKKSMYSTMLKTLGHNAPQAMQKCLNDLISRKQKFIEKHDPDSADRTDIQIECILRVQALITELGGNA